MIPVANPLAQYLSYKEEIDQAIARVTNGGFYILGEETRNFEIEFAEYVGVAHCIGVGNGTDALAIALRAVGIRPGDEVITVSHTAVATVAAIESTGANPVLADIEEDSYCICPESVQRLISNKTKAIIPVHIFGHPADMERICALAKKHNLKVIEDCAQAHGARINGKKVGTFGDMATFSFYPTKNLGCIGDGGAVVSNNAELAESALLLRQYGWKERYISLYPGLNSRLDELQAAILRVKLKHLDQDNKKRGEIARHYNQAIGSCKSDRITAPKVRPGTEHVMHLYVVQSPDRDLARKIFEKQSVATALHYPMAVHQQPAYLKRLRKDDSLKNTERLYKSMFSLPMFPELDSRNIQQVCNMLIEL